jgi:hypothetical protein
MAFLLRREWMADHSRAGRLAAFRRTQLTTARHRSTTAGLVSQDKRRFQQDGYDLDLSYITGRIIGMGFPSSGAHGLFRNPLPQVVSLLQRYHASRYKVYNLCSERAYPAEQMQGPVACYPSDDHQVRPPAAAAACCGPGPQRPAGQGRAAPRPLQPQPGRAGGRAAPRLPAQAPGRPPSWPLAADQRPAPAPPRRSPRRCPSSGPSAATPPPGCWRTPTTWRPCTARRARAAPASWSAACCSTCTTSTRTSSACRPAPTRAARCRRRCGSSPTGAPTTATASPSPASSDTWSTSTGS